MIEIVFASANEHKVQEVNEIAAPFGVSFVAPNQGFDPNETGKTFEENSAIKAVEAARVNLRGKKLFLADDSGLCVDALNGEPGLKSARYAETPEKRIKKVLEALAVCEGQRAASVRVPSQEGQPATDSPKPFDGDVKVSERNSTGANRAAQFICAMTLCDEQGEILHTTKGICKGEIAYVPTGSGGFGYDPIFIPQGYNCSLAEIPEEEKNAISHRGKALRDMLIWVKLA